MQTHILINEILDLNSDEVMVIVFMNTVATIDYDKLTKAEFTNLMIEVSRTYESTGKACLDRAVMETGTEYTTLNDRIYLKSVIQFEKAGVELTLGEALERALID